MFHFRKSPPIAPPLQTAEAALYGVIDRTQAMIRFRPDGTILDANDNFLATAVSYTHLTLPTKRIV